MAVKRSKQIAKVQQLVDMKGNEYYGEIHFSNASELLAFILQYNDAPKAD